VSCSECCSKKQGKAGTQYYHQLLAAVIVHSNSKFGQLGQF
jgi:hypothetical protein